MRTELIRLDADVVIILGDAAVISRAVAEAAADPSATGPSREAAATLRLLAQIDVTTSQAPGYQRSGFGSGWTVVQGCNTRQRVLARDLNTITRHADGCRVVSGVLNDPYTGNRINFTNQNPNAAQIDHIVAVSSAWKMGANDWTRQERVSFYNDTDNLLAVDGPTNQRKSDYTLGEWQPPNANFHCDFAINYIEVTAEYDLALKPHRRHLRRGPAA